MLARKRVTGGQGPRVAVQGTKTWGQNLYQEFRPKIARVHVSRVSCGSTSVAAVLAIHDLRKCSGGTSRRRDRTLACSTTNGYKCRLCGTKKTPQAHRRYQNVGAKPVSGQGDPLYATRGTRAVARSLFFFTSIFSLLLPLLRSELLRSGALLLHLLRSDLPRSELLRSGALLLLLLPNKYLL